MKTVQIEDLMISIILTFCENAAELGCPRDKDVDMWFRELCYDDPNGIEKAREIMNKILDIQEKYETERKN